MEIKKREMDDEEMSLTGQWFCQGSLTILLEIPLASLSII